MCGQSFKKKKKHKSIDLKISTKMQRCDMVDTYDEHVPGHP